MDNVKVEVSSGATGNVSVQVENVENLENADNNGISLDIGGVKVDTTNGVNVNIGDAIKVDTASGVDVNIADAVKVNTENGVNVNIADAVKVDTENGVNVEIPGVQVSPTNVKIDGLVDIDL